MPRLEDDLAASFRQGSLLAQRDPGISAEALVFGDALAVGGVCFALSSLWVVRHMGHRGEGPAGRAAHLAREAIFQSAMAAHVAAMQGARLAQPPDTAGEDYRRHMLTGMGLGWTAVPLGDIRGAGRALEAQAGELLASLMSSHAYHFLTLYGKAPALGHAMAAYTASALPQGPPLLHVFDPNWGEFKVSALHARAFLARLLGWYDGHREFGRIARLSVGRLRRQG